MTTEKFIVIGCDDMADLSLLLRALETKTFFAHKIVSAARNSDLMDIIRSFEPDLVILNFRNNQAVLNNLNSFINKPDIPILCLTKMHEGAVLSWSPSSIVFTYPFQHISANNEYLASRINAIFLLKERALEKRPVTSFAEAAIQLNQADNTRNMSRYVLELDQKIETMLKIKDRIAELYNKVDDKVRAELTSIVHTIKMSANDNKLWEDFKLYFEQTNPGFLLVLSRKYPFLTPIDLKYCCYLKMNMSNDDIRNLLGINQESVRTHKYRLKKKMSLTKEQDLRTYLRSVYQ